MTHCVLAILVCQAREALRPQHIACNAGQAIDEQRKIGHSVSYMKSDPTKSNTHAFWRLKRLRELKGVTLEELAKRTVLTKSYLSKVERGMSVPSIATALKLADAFDVDVGELFGKGGVERDFVVVRKNERKPFGGRNSKAGQRNEAIAPGQAHGLYEAFVTYPPFSEPRGYQPAEHRGHEMMFVVRGRVDVAFPNTSVKLEEGDSMVFSGHIPHRILSLRPKRAEILVFVANEKEPAR